MAMQQLGRNLGKYFVDFRALSAMGGTTMAPQSARHFCSGVALKKGRLRRLVDFFEFPVKFTAASASGAVCGVGIAYIEASSNLWRSGYNSGNGGSGKDGV